MGVRLFRLFEGKLIPALKCLSNMFAVTNMLPGTNHLSAVTNVSAVTNWSAVINMLAVTHICRLPSAGRGTPHLMPVRVAEC